MADKRGRTLVALGVVLALVLGASWLAFDQLLSGARATTPQISTQDPYDPATGGRQSGAGSSGVAKAASEPARRDNPGPAENVGASSGIQSSYLSDAIASSGSIGVGTATGGVGSGPGSNGSVAAFVPGSTQSAGAGPSTEVSTASQALRSNPAADTEAPPGGPSGNVTPTRSGPAPSSAPPNEPGPLDNRHSGPSGGTIEPVMSAESGAGPNTGSDNPDRFVTDWGSGTSGTAGASDVPANPVPVPPSLLLFGVSALVLWVVSRVRRAPPNSRREPPLIG